MSGDIRPAFQRFSDERPGTRFNRNFQFEIILNEISNVGEVSIQPVSPAQEMDQAGIFVLRRRIQEDEAEMLAELRRRVPGYVRETDALIPNVR